MQVIAVTGYGSEEDTSIFKNKGFDDYFPKPLVIEQLMEKLNRIAGKL
jgi:CheY-like chemotaxis protein